MRFHLLALPNSQTTRAYFLCGFCQLTIRFARLLKELGHTVHLYASEENEAPCDELVTCVTRDEQEGVFGGIPYHWANVNNECGILWEKSNARMIAETAKRKQPGDFLCTLGGRANKPVSDSHPDFLTVEYSIGYPGSFAPYRVYESQCWREADAHRWNTPQANRTDATIPLFFDPAEFPTRQPEGFALYVGRLIPMKGIGLACQAAQKADLPLKIIGSGDPSLITYGEYLGTISNPERNELMARASVILCPTQYFEPFGAVAVEAQLCGTPVACSGTGGFTETVEHARTGYLCNTFPELVRGLIHAPRLDRDYIRARAIAQYSMHALKDRYQNYFERIASLC